MLVTSEDLRLADRDFQAPDALGPWLPRTGGSRATRCLLTTRSRRETDSKTRLPPGLDRLPSIVGSHEHRNSQHPAPKRGVAAGRSAQRACERSSDWRRGAAGSPDPYEFTADPSLRLG